MQQDKQKLITWGAMVWNHIMYLIIVLLINYAMEITEPHFSLYIFYVLLTIGFTLAVIIFQYSRRNNIDSSRGIILQAIPQSFSLLGIVIYVLLGVYGE